MQPRPSGTSFNELLSQAALGAAAAHEELLALYRPYLRLAAGQRLPRIVAKRVDASDIVQETLLDAVRGLPDFRGTTEPELTAWMTKLLERNVLQSIRKNTSAKRDVRLELDQSFQDGSAQLMWHTLSGGGSSPDSRVFRGEAALHLANALDKLPDDQRIAVEMRYIDQQSLQQIADAMGRSIGSAAGLIRRGVEAMQAHLPAELGELS